MPRSYDFSGPYRGFENKTPPEWYTAAQNGDRTPVPCNGCTLCCEHDLILLHPDLGDDPALYETMAVTHPLTGEPALALKLESGTAGRCRYLGADGCTIHDHAPAICRVFDCRAAARQLLATYSRTQRRRMAKAGLISKAVLRRGLELEDSS